MDATTKPDENYVRAWRDGRREDAATVLHRRYDRRLFGFFRGLHLPDDTCRELVQDTFLQAFRALDGFRSESSFQTWLFKIARNAAKKSLRHQLADKRFAPEVPIHEINYDGDDGDVPLALVEGDGDGPLDQVLAREECHQLRAAVGSLAPEDRHMVRFRVAQELSVGETALAFRIPEGTVKSRWARIRDTLRRKLESYYSDLPF